MLVINSLYDNYSNIIQSLENFEKATDVVLFDKIKQKKGLVIFIDDKNMVEMVSMYEIGHRIATKKNRIKFYDKKDLTYKIREDELVSVFSRFSGDIYKLYSFTTIASLAPVFAQNLEDFIFEKNPEIAKYFKLGKKYKEIDVSEYPTAKLEFDALTLPLKTIGIDNISFLNYKLKTSSSLLENIYTDYMTEEQMLANDFAVFKFAKIFEPDILVGRKFRTSKMGKAVSVFYANRTKYEKIMGVDLILYNSEYKSYIFMQYKRMLEEKGVVAYRMDRQLDNEISRMKMMLETTLNNTQTRLNSNPFYFKFCPSRQESCIVADMQLIKGIILPLETFESFRNDGRFVGKNGGMVVSYENVNQYMDNTLFINLYKNGWIGSSKIDSLSIERYLESRLDGGHSIVLAAT